MTISDEINDNTKNKNPYEDARNQRLLENKRRFEELGISQISKSLSEAIKVMKKPQKPRTLTSRPEITDIRRSSRERNPATYNEKELGAYQYLKKYKKQLRKQLPEAERLRLAEEKQLKKKLAEANLLKKKLSQVTQPKRKYRKPNFTSTTELNSSELRRSSRGYSHVSYDEDVTDDDELEALVAHELRTME